MRSLGLLAALVGTSLIGTALHAEMKHGAVLDSGYYYQTNGGVVDGDKAVKTKGVQGFKQGKIDIWSSWEEGEASGKIKLDMLTLIKGDAAKFKLDFIDDAWIQYKFHDAVALKMGLMYHYINAYGRWTTFSFPGGQGSALYDTNTLDLDRTKFEISGAVSGLSYGVMVWEDVDNKKYTVADAAKYKDKDADNGLHTNSSFKLQYNMPILEVGAIAVHDYKDTATGRSSMAYSAYAKYINKAPEFNAWLRYTQKAKVNNELGNTAIAAGFSFLDLKPIDINVSVDYIASKYVEAKEKTDKKAGLVADLMVGYSTNKMVKIFAQVLHKGDGVVGYAGDTNSGAYQQFITGFQGRF